MVTNCWIPYVAVTYSVRLVPERYWQESRIATCGVNANPPPDRPSGKMPPRASRPPWQRKIESEVVRIDQRIAREIREERSEREKADAGTLEDVEELSEALGRLGETQAELAQRLAWLEKLMGVQARPVRPPRPRKG